MDTTVARLHSGHFMARSISLPQATTDVDAALALVCTIPATGRTERRASVESAAALELRVEATADLVSALKDLYVGVKLEFRKLWPSSPL